MSAHGNFKIVANLIFHFQIMYLSLIIVRPYLVLCVTATLLILHTLLYQRSETIRIFAVISEQQEKQFPDPEPIPLYHSEQSLGFPLSPHFNTSYCFGALHYVSLCSLSISRSLHKETTACAGTRVYCDKSSFQARLVTFQYDKI